MNDFYVDTQLNAVSSTGEWLPVWSVIKRQFNPDLHLELQLA